MFDWLRPTDAIAFCTAFPSNWCKDGWMVLLFKASRDGFTGWHFHLKCDNKGQTWTVIQDVKGFGGYTSVSWRGQSTCL